MPNETKVALPVANVAIGYVNVNGQQLPVMIDREWMLPLSRLVDRTGGVLALTTTEVAEQSAAIMQQNMESMRANNDLPMQKIAELEARIEDLPRPIQVAAAAAAPSGSVSFTDATINVSYNSRQYAEVSVVDAAILAGSKVLIDWGDFTDTDENTPDMDDVRFNAIVSAGSMVVRMSTTERFGRLGGAYKIKYLIAT